MNDRECKAIFTLAAGLSLVGMSYEGYQHNIVPIYKQIQNNVDSEIPQLWENKIEWARSTKTKFRNELAFQRRLTIPELKVIINNASEDAENIVLEYDKTRSMRQELNDVLLRRQGKSFFAAEAILKILGYTGSILTFIGAINGYKAVYNKSPQLRSNLALINPFRVDVDEVELRST